jgi:hypothetical protein
LKALERFQYRVPRKFKQEVKFGAGPASFSPPKRTEGKQLFCSWQSSGFLLFFFVLIFPDFSNNLPYSPPLTINQEPTTDFI